MKKFSTIIVLLLACTSAFSQEPAATPSLAPWQSSWKEPHPYPKSIIDVGVGIGPNFGTIGGQVIVGYKGSGLLAAAGSWDGMFCYAIGAQFSVDWLYVNASWAVVGESTDGSTNTTTPITGLVLMAGGKINVLKSKKLYLQLGVGYEMAKEQTPFGPADFNSPTFALGIGYRIAFKKEGQ